MKNYDKDPIEIKNSDKNKKPVGTQIGLGSQQKQLTNQKNQPTDKKQKGNFDLSESFKLQALTGDVDLQGKNLSDNHCMQICQLIKQYA